MHIYVCIYTFTYMEYSVCFFFETPTPSSGSWSEVNYVPQGVQDAVMSQAGVIYPSQIYIKEGRWPL